MTDEEKAWIDNASYYDLLKRNRFSSSGDAIFHGKSGAYYLTVMFEKKRALPPGEAVAISKRIGWER